MKLQDLKESAKGSSKDKPEVIEKEELDFLFSLIHKALTPLVDEVKESFLHFAGRTERILRAKFRTSAPGSAKIDDSFVTISYMFPEKGKKAISGTGWYVQVFKDAEGFDAPIFELGRSDNPREALAKAVQWVKATKEKYPLETTKEKAP